MKYESIQSYNIAQEAGRSEICVRLAAEISRGLPEAEGKIWHGGPVWFIDGNPVVGYWNRKSHVTLLFWSGQSFDEPDLIPTGSFKVAEAHYVDSAAVQHDDIARWLEKARNIQWDYKNIVKRKGNLERLI